MPGSVLTASSQRAERRDVRARVPAIDGLRGVLAVVVLAWHVCYPFGLYWMAAPANWSVKIFFVLSGYVLTRGWDGQLGLFLMRRFLRLWPTYALCLAVGYVIADVHPVWSEFFWYPYMGPNDPAAIDPPMWSLFLEAWAMPLMPLIVLAGTRSWSRAFLVFLLLQVIGQTIPRVGFLGFFVAGAFAARFEFRIRILETSIPQWLGKISYSLYLSHVLVFKVAVNALGPWGGVAAVPAAFAIAWLIWFLVERPSIWASRRVSRALRITRSWRNAADAATPSFNPIGPAQADESIHARSAGTIALP